jgi:hypothetical protein
MNFFPDFSHVSSSYGGTLSTVAALAPFLQGFQDLDAIFIVSFPFSDASLGLLSKPPSGGFLKGFIAPYLPPKNLNGWDITLEGAYRVLEPLSLSGDVFKIFSSCWELYWMQNSPSGRHAIWHWLVY